MRGVLGLGRRGVGVREVLRGVVVEGCV